MTEPVFLEIGIGIWANIFVALATFTLATITWLTVGHLKKQMILLKKQNLLSISSQNPILQVEEFKMKENTIIFKIKNVGKGDAYQIGIHSNSSLAKPVIEGHDNENGVPLGTYSNHKNLLSL